MNSEQARRVLIVASDVNVRAALVNALGGDKYQLVFAANGQDAIEEIIEEPPDLVLLDQMLSGTSGFQVCSQIRKMEGLAEVPIILVTPLNSLEVKVSAFEAGADDVLSKPMSAVEIRMRVRNTTGLNRYRSLLQSRGDTDRALHMLQDAYSQTIEGWAMALELRDGETKGHSERVTTWTLDLAKAFGIEGYEFECIRRGALLHDIGKMGVPDSVLLKPGPLDTDERKVMEQHPILARNMLSRVKYLEDSIDIPYWHHERWDGKGYPDGIGGAEIPFHARMFSIVDVYDALRSDRPYRKAWDEVRVLEYLDTQSGTQFDGRIVRVFASLVEKKRLSEPRKLTSAAIE